MARPWILRAAGGAPGSADARSRTIQSRVSRGSIRGGFGDTDSPRGARRPLDRGLDPLVGLAGGHTRGGVRRRSSGPGGGTGGVDSRGLQAKAVGVLTPACRECAVGRRPEYPCSASNLSRIAFHLVVRIFRLDKVFMTLPSLEYRRGDSTLMFLKKIKTESPPPG